MKKYLEKAMSTFNENRSLFIQVSLVLGLILAILSFSKFIAPLFIILIFLILPFVVSVFAICMKAGDNREVENRDIFFGFKNFGTAMTLTTKIILKPILFAILTYFVINLIGNGITLYVLIANGDPIFEIAQSGDAQALLTAFNQLMTTNIWFTVTNDIGLIVGFIVGFNIFIKHSFAPFICFETTFTLDSAKKLSINLTKESKGYCKINNIFLIFYVLSMGLLLVLTIIIGNSTANPLLIYFIVALAIYSFMSPLIFINVLTMYHYYDENHRENVKNLYKDYINVSMRTTESKMIDDEFKEEEKNDEDKGQ